MHFSISIFENWLQHKNFRLHTRNNEDTARHEIGKDFLAFILQVFGLPSLGWLILNPYPMKRFHHLTARSLHKIKQHQKDRKYNAPVYRELSQKKLTEIKQKSEIKQKLQTEIKQKSLTHLQEMRIRKLSIRRKRLSHNLGYLNMFRKF